MKAICNFEGSNLPAQGNKHAKDGMIAVHSSRWLMSKVLHEGAAFYFEGGEKPAYYKSHAEDDMG